ncbi:MAG: DUF5694 domain-containing protein [Cyclobacteriaceae bacterium]
MKYVITIILVVTMSLFNSLYAQLGDVDQNAEKKPTIAFLGTYHMGSQGNNVYKGNYDDILSPVRQLELDTLIKKLKEFKPTKVLIEQDISRASKIQELYTKYLEGNFELKRNEIFQIGFRLARAMNHKKIYSVDWGIFPSDSLYWYENYAKKDSVQNEFLKEIRKKGKVRHDKRVEETNKLSVVNQLRWLNTKENYENAHTGYFNIMRIGLGDEYVGANYLSWWYERNMKILVNIIRITESPDDRILVLYGAGHLKLLNQLTKESKFYDVRNTLDILKD